MVVASFAFIFSPKIDLEEATGRVVGKFVPGGSALKASLLSSETMTRWWFQICFFKATTWGNDPI